MTRTGIVRGAAMLVSLFIVSFVVVTGSRAAFVDTTDDAGNQWSAGTVSIIDDDSGSAMFNAADMKPGDTVESCIAVTYNGSITPADVALYGTTAGTGLDTYLDLSIEIGNGGSFGDCTGFTSTASLYSGTLANFSATHTDFASGLGSWSPAASPETMTYHFVVTLQDNNAAQGLNASATFTWEAQNQ